MKESTPRCEDMADKLVRLFGWRQTYPVQKLQRSILPETHENSGPETWVGVRALRASSGGILDPDDRVRDVADDRETLTAECTQAPQPRAAQADGASGMRVPATDSCVEVGAGDMEDGSSGLQVRRGSEPTLHQDTLPPQRTVTEQTKRWSAAVVCRDDSSRTSQKHPMSEGRPPDTSDRHGHGHFQRQTNRSGVWLDAADKVQTYGSKSLPRDARREPLGQDTPVTNHRYTFTHIPTLHLVEDMLRWVSGVNNRAVSGLEVPVSPSAKSKPSSGSTQSVAVTLVKGEKGLGFTITTRDNPTAIGPPTVKEKCSENGRVSSIVSAINGSGCSVRSRVANSSSKDDLTKDQSAESALQEALNTSSSS
ncbi:Partitioning defective 3, partial [Operophtera brumata]